MLDPKTLSLLSPAEPKDDAATFTDGDSGYFGSDKKDGFRIKGMNTPESENNFDRVDKHPDGKLAAETIKILQSEGAQVIRGDSKGAYGRGLSEFVDAEGSDLTQDMVRSGLAFPDRSREAAEAASDRNEREFLGKPTTFNKTIREQAEKRQGGRNFTPWNEGEADDVAHDRRGTFHKAWDRGNDQTKAALGGVMNYIGDLIGNDEWVSEGKAMTRSANLDIDLNPREVESYKDVKNLDDAFDYLLETTGELAPGLILDTVATIGTGGLALGAVATRRVGSAALVGAAKLAAEKSMKKAVKVGMISGPVATGFLQSLGGMENTLEERGSEVNTGAAALSGVVGGAVNVIPYALVAGDILKQSGLADDVVKKVVEGVEQAEKSGFLSKAGGRLKDITKTAGKAGAGELFTEVPQMYIDELIASSNTDGKWQLETTDAIDGALRAVFGGAAMGGTASIAANTVSIVNEYNQARSEAAADDPSSYENIPEGEEATGEEAPLNFEEMLDDPSDKTEEEGDTSAVSRGKAALNDIIKAAGDMGSGANDFVRGRDESSTLQNMRDRGNGDGEVIQEQDTTSEGEALSAFTEDVMRREDVPYLEGDRRVAVEKLLAPEGVLLSLNEVATLIKSGEVTGNEVVMYTVDPMTNVEGVVFKDQTGEAEVMRMDDALAEAESAARKGNVPRSVIKEIGEARQDDYVAVKRKALEAVKSLAGKVADETRSVISNGIDSRDKKQRDAAIAAIIELEGSGVLESGGEISNSLRAGHRVSSGRSRVKAAEAVAKLGKKGYEILGKKAPAAYNWQRTYNSYVTAVNDDKAKKEAAKNPAQTVKPKEAEKTVDRSEVKFDKKVKQKDVVGQRKALKLLAVGNEKARKMVEMVDLAIKQRGIGEGETTDNELNQVVEAMWSTYQDFANVKDDKPAAAVAWYKETEKLAAQGDEAALTILSEINDTKTGKAETQENWTDTQKKLWDKYQEFKAEGDLSDDKLNIEASEGDERSLDERTGGAVQDTFEADYRSDQEVKEDFRRRTGRNLSLMKNLSSLRKGFGGEALSTFINYINRKTSRESITRDLVRGGEVEKVYNYALPNTEKDKNFEASAKGAKVQNQDITIAPRTLIKIGILISQRKFKEAEALLAKKGMIDVDDTPALDENPKLSLDQRIMSLVEKGHFKNKRLSEQDAKGRTISIVDRETGVDRNIDLDTLVRFVLENEMSFDFDAVTPHRKLLKEVSNAAYAALSMISSAKTTGGLNKYDIDLTTIPDDTIVFRGAGDATAGVRMGTIRNQMARTEYWTLDFKNKGQGEDLSLEKLQEKLNAEGPGDNSYIDSDGNVKLTKTITGDDGKTTTVELNPEELIEYIDTEALLGNEEFTGEHHSQDDSLDHGKRTETTLEVEADNSDITGSVNSDEATRSGMGKPKAEDKKADDKPTVVVTKASAKIIKEVKDKIKALKASIANLKAGVTRKVESDPRVQEIKRKIATFESQINDIQKGTEGESPNNRVELEAELNALTSKLRTVESKINRSDNKNSRGLRSEIAKLNKKLTAPVPAGVMNALDVAQRSFDAASDMYTRATTTRDKVGNLRMDSIRKATKALEAAKAALDKLSGQKFNESSWSRAKDTLRKAKAAQAKALKGKNGRINIGQAKRASEKLDQAKDDFYAVDSRREVIQSQIDALNRQLAVTAKPLISERLAADKISNRIDQIKTKMGKIVTERETSKLQRAQSSLEVARAKQKMLERQNPSPENYKAIDRAKAAVIEAKAILKVSIETEGTIESGPQDLESLENTLPKLEATVKRITRKVSEGKSNQKALDRAKAKLYATRGKIKDIKEAEARVADPATLQRQLDDARRELSEMNEQINRNLNPEGRRDESIAAQEVALKKLNEKLEGLNPQQSTIWTDKQRKDKSRGKSTRQKGQTFQSKQLTPEQAATLMDDKPPSMPKSKRVEANNKLIKGTRRRKKHVRQGVFKYFYMVKSRLTNIHTEAGRLATKYTNEKRMRSAQMITWINKDFANSEEVQKGYEDYASGRKTPAAEKYIEFIGKVDDLTSKYDKGMKVSYGEGGAIHLDYSKLADNPVAFKKILLDAKIKDAEKIYTRVMEGGGYEGMGIDATSRRGIRAPTSGVANAALAPAFEQLKAAGFLDTDAPRHLIRYATAASNRLAWNHAYGEFGNNGEWDSYKKYDEITSEVHPKNANEYFKLMKGVTGGYSNDVRPMLRKFNSVAMAFQASTVLWFSGVASIPELAVIYSRNRDTLEGMGVDIRTLLSGKGRAELLQVAQDFEIVAPEVIEHSLQMLYNMDDVTTGRVSQKILSTVFKLNGQTALTEITRALGVKIGQRFLERHAGKDTPNSKRMLAELGVTAKEVKSFIESGDMSSPEGQKYRDALHRFVDESVTNPTAAQVPLIGSDPLFAIFASLKKFFYGFYDNVHKSLWNDAKIRRTEGVSTVVPLMITGALLLPLGIVAELLRELIKYPMGRPGGSKDFGDMLYSGGMATGLLGPVHLIESAYEQTTFGKSAALSFLGPTIGVAVDTANGDAKPSRFVPLPLVTQHPYLSREFNKMVKSFME